MNIYLFNEKSKFVGSPRFLKINYSACWKLITYLRFVQKTRKSEFSSQLIFLPFISSTKWISRSPSIYMKTFGLFFLLKRGKSSCAVGVPQAYIQTSWFHSKQTQVMTTNVQPNWKKNVNLGASLYTLMLCFKNHVFSYLSIWFFFAAIYQKYEDENNMLIFKKLPQITKGSVKYLSLVCSLGSPPRRLCVAMDSPKAISLFLTIQHIHACLPFQETWGLGLTTFFSPCVLWMHCWHLHFLSSQLSSS